MGQLSGKMRFQWDNHLEKCGVNGKIIYKSGFELGNFAMKRTFSHGEVSMELT